VIQKYSILLNEKISPQNDIIKIESFVLNPEIKEERRGNALPFYSIEFSIGLTLPLRYDS